MKPFLLTMLLALVFALVFTPTLIQAQVDLIVAADRSCADARGTLGAAFDIQGDNNRDSWYWVGLYRAEDITPDRNRRGEFFLEGEPELWVWTCGTQNCNRNTRRGEVIFGSGRHGAWEGTSWPSVQPGRHRLVLVNYIDGNDDIAFYKAVAVSSTLDIERACEGEEEEEEEEEEEPEQGNPFDGRDTDQEEEDEPEPVPVPAPAPVPTSRPPQNFGMADVVAEARRDLRDLINGRRILSPLWLRMIFHDCVGGRCDGCININNPENGGLTFAMNQLTDLEEKYRPRGLSRADLWVLASYVGVEMTIPGVDPVTDPFIPFEKFGRQDCGDRMTRGPDPELCHPDMTTNDIVDFFEEEFNFTPQETAAIMGAHTIGILRRQILGFNGPNGWVPDNTRFDHEYYIELVGRGSTVNSQVEGAPQWRLAQVENGDLSDLPDRHQWEGFPGGRKVVMLNSDVAMVRQLDDSNMDHDTGKVSCKFVSRAPGNDPICPVARMDLFQHMVNYAQSNTRFLNDFRDAMIKMTDVGYRVGVCDSEGMCQLEANN